MRIVSALKFKDTNTVRKYYFPIRTLYHNFLIAVVSLYRWLPKFLNGIKKKKHIRPYFDYKNELNEK